GGRGAGERSQKSEVGIQRAEVRVGGRRAGVGGLVWGGGKAVVMRFRTFQDVDGWKKAHALVLAIYRMTKKFPREELFGLTSQIRRSATSVPANFAEGFKRRGKADKLRCYNIAQSSLEETRYYLILTQDLEYARTDGLLARLEEVSRM